MDEEWAERKRQQDIDELNIERAGHSQSVGRIRRFMPERDTEHAESKRKENDARISLLMEMMRDLAYAKAYQAAGQALNDAQTALDIALTENALETEEHEANLIVMEERAARLPDGRLVFRAADGSLRCAEGRRLRSDAISPSLVIFSDAPTYEAYTAQRDALRNARVQGVELAEIQTTVLDPAADQLNDQDNPLSTGDLDDLREDLLGVPDRITSSQVERDLEAPSTNEEATAPYANAFLSLDDLGPAR
jgi:hypothetical protein